MSSMLIKQSSQSPNQPPAGIEKAKSGRKRKEETIKYLPTPMNPYFKIYQKLIQYLDEIGLIHGLCFTPELRRSLKNHNKNSEIKWDQKSDGWCYQKQIYDLRNNQRLMIRLRRVMFVIKRKIRKQMLSNDQKNSGLLENNLNNLAKWSFNKILDLVIRPGEMVDLECRKQFYTLNITILQCIFTKNKGQQTIQVQKFLDNSQFFSRKFTTYKKKNWIQFKKCTNEELYSKFLKMYKHFKRNYKYILFDFQDFNQYNDDMKYLFDQVTQQFKEQVVKQQDQDEGKIQQAEQ